MQDRQPPDRRNFLRHTAGPYIRVNFAISQSALEWRLLLRIRKSRGVSPITQNAGNRHSQSRFDLARAAPTSVQSVPASLRPFGSPGTQSANSNSAMSLSRPPQVVLEFESKVASVELSCLSAPMSKSLSRRRRLARADCIAFVTRYCCWSGRRLRRPSEVVDYVLAFWVIRDLIATCAQPAGVLLCSASRAKTSAPAATSSFTISRSPFHAAECRAVPCDPHAAFALTWAPWESNQRTSSWWLSG